MSEVGSTAHPSSAGNFASPARRLAAAVADWAFLGIVTYILLSVLSEAFDRYDESVIVLAMVGISAAYYAGLTWLWGATPGKALTGMEVVRADGTWPSLSRSVLRFLVWALLPVIAWAFVLSGARRGIHDQIADTYVVLSAR